MNQEEFDILLNNRLDKIKTTLEKKAGEYSMLGDRLHNFKVAARIKDETPAQALWGIAMKHLVCIEDIIKERISPDKKFLDEKIGDMINYLILLEAILLE